MKHKTTMKTIIVAKNGLGDVISKVTVETDASWYQDQVSFGVQKLMNRLYINVSAKRSKK